MLTIKLHVQLQITSVVAGHGDENLSRVLSAHGRGSKPCPLYDVGDLRESHTVGTSTGGTGAGLIAGGGGGNGCLVTPLYGLHCRRERLNMPSIHNMEIVLNKR